MKRLLILSSITLLLTSCFSPERDCKRFHTGTFQFESYLNGELVTSTFTRSEGLEIDKFQGQVDTSSVRWINDCEYIIQNLHPKNRAEKQPLHIKILTTDKDSYTFEYGLVGDPEKQRGTVTKIE
ncbi:DNA topoisomerase IV [Gillisia sp. M10.2A]|uniref:DNA topoisomerase IV n=1 Tax=Gillisia lutea TaxID=2909668 RepID=A0ABS9EIU5_9FLAO|nr:DNA topoisomerase IV [Gillisia lutea]MCF4101715.1 DNA topoisomerase IV [Gillisia lutea]